MKMFLCICLLYNQYTSEFFVIFAKNHEVCGKLLYLQLRSQSIFQECQQKTGVSWVRNKGLNCSQHRKQQDHQHIALVLFAKTHRVVQWAQMTPAHTVSCITGEDPRAKSAELFEQIERHYSKQHTTQPYPSSLSMCPPPPSPGLSTVTLTYLMPM